MAFDGAPRDFLMWALESDPPLATPLARLFHAAGLPVPASVREARARTFAANPRPRTGRSPVTTCHGGRLSSIPGYSVRAAAACASNTVIRTAGPNASRTVSIRPWRIAESPVLRTTVLITNTFIRSAVRAGPRRGHRHGEEKPCASTCNRVV